ncbi:MAG TPA: dethiobiotin synthase [Aldersonia sp.]
MSVLLVGGTSTDVGKTIATAALAAVAAGAGRRVAVCKPAQTGVAPDEPGDLAEITRLTGVTDTLELARYPEPLAPDTAARRSGLPMLNLDDVVVAVRTLDATHDLTLVEGAGGVLVRLGRDGFTLVDVARALAAPMVVVTAAGLGTLNHSELTTRALAASAVDCAGLLIGAWPAEPDLAARCNLIDLPEVTGIAIAGSIPEGVGTLPTQQFVSESPGWLDKDWVCRYLYP